MSYQKLFVPCICWDMERFWLSKHVDTFLRLCKSSSFQRWFFFMVWILKFLIWSRDGLQNSPTDTKYSINGHIRNNRVNLCFDVNWTCKRCFLIIFSRNSRSTSPSRPNLRNTRKVNSQTTLHIWSNWPCERLYTKLMISTVINNSGQFWV